jgi:two-component system, cell cycle response regulator DivK
MSGPTDRDEAALVLIVEDYEEGREICAEYLRFRGYRVATAEDGREGLEKAFELAPDLILMDLSLPSMDGWEATRRLRQDPRTRHTPVIALTAHALASARAKALEAGCDEVVTKPVVPRDLEAVVRLQLERATSRQAQAGGASRPRSEGESS